MEQMDEIYIKYYGIKRVDVDKWITFDNGMVFGTPSIHHALMQLEYIEMAMEWKCAVCRFSDGTVVDGDLDG